MDPIRYWAFALLSLSILALHVTTPHKYVAYIPAIEDNFKVRPAGLEEPLAVVVTLEEADRRYKRLNLHQQKVEDDNHHYGCWIDSCDLELEIKLVKARLAEFFSS